LVYRKIFPVVLAITRRDTFRCSAMKDKTAPIRESRSTVHIPEKLHAQLKEIAHREGMLLWRLVDKLLEAGVAQYEQRGSK
jgi:predicted DNA-binding ribbon-helix-helix protein